MPKSPQRLDELADLLEFQGANAFRVRAYRNGSRAIRNMSQSVAQMVEENPDQLTDLDGIGQSVAEKCVTLVRTGRLPQLESLLAEIPESVLTLLRIPGLGPKKAAVLFQQLGVATLEQLRAACESQQVRALKGFGAKTEQAILDGMHVAETAAQRMYWADADAIVAQLREHLRACPAVERLEFAGSYRRGKETVGDLDALVISVDPQAVMDWLGTWEAVAETLGRGDTKMSVRLRSGLQVDLRVVPRESFGAALQYFTGSKEHNVALRGRAKQRGLKINEYGVYRVEGEHEERVAGASEEEVYATLGPAGVSARIAGGPPGVPLGRGRERCRNWSPSTTSWAICTCIRPRPTAWHRSRKWWTPLVVADCSTSRSPIIPSA